MKSKLFKNKNIKNSKNKNTIRGKLLNDISNNYELYIMILPLIIYIFIFRYIPMLGIQLAFKDFNPYIGMWNSPWVGFEYFTKFFNSFNFWLLMRNTLGLSLYKLIVGFPIPIILAVMMNYIINKKYKKFVQTITYAPHFISVVVLVGMLNVFLSPRTGLVNLLIQSLGFDAVFFTGRADLFKSLYVFSSIWQQAGWSSIIYLAALTGIDPSLHEAAIVDGASKLQRVLKIDLPSLKSTIIIILILNIGKLMNVGFEKVLLMQNPLNLESSQIIQTYVYKMGLQNLQYSYATAVGLFNNIINCILLITANRISKKYSESSLW